MRPAQQAFSGEPVRCDRQSADCRPWLQPRKYLVLAVYRRGAGSAGGLPQKKIAWQQLRPQLKTVIVAGLAMAGYVLCWFLGIKHIGAAIPTLIALCLPPVLVTLYALLRRQETLNFQLVGLLLAALTGTILIVFRHDSGATATDLHELTLGGAICHGIRLPLCLFFPLLSGPADKAPWRGPNDNLRDDCRGSGHGGFRPAPAPVLAGRGSAPGLVSLPGRDHCRPGAARIQLGRGAADADHPDRCHPGRTAHRGDPGSSLFRRTARPLAMVRRRSSAIQHLGAGTATIRIMAAAGLS